ncbi:hypothetical protein RSAG8_03515, partial [Rhizoctonia solani AG-8 WAC10335]
MYTFIGYPRTEAQLRELAVKYDSPYADFPNAATEIAWELNDLFREDGPFRLMTALISGQVGYVFVIGMENGDKSTIPPELKHSTKYIFGSEPEQFSMNVNLGKWTYTSENNVIVEAGGMIT